MMLNPSKRTANKFLGIYVLLLSLFAGLRFHTGWDWEAYDYFFNLLNQANIYNFFSYNIFNYEPGFVLLSYISILLNIPPFLLFAIITVSLIVSSAHKYLGKFVYIFCLIYLYYGYFHNFSIVRQGIAAALFAYSIRFLIVRSYKFYFVIIFASLFHISAAMLLAIPLLLVIANRVPFFLLLLLSICMVLLPLSDMLGLKSLMSKIPALNIYLNNSTLSYKVGFSLKYLELLIVFYCYYERKVFLPLINNFGIRQFWIFKGLIIIELMIYSIFNDYSIIYERLSVYFEFSHAIAIAMIVSTFKYKRIQFFLMLILLFFVFARYYQLVYSPVRVPGEMSHLERFENYCSIFNERECQR